MTDDSFGPPCLNAEQLGVLLGMTERMVKDRVARDEFICHWTGGTEENPRGMVFTAEDVTYNRGTLRTSRPTTPTGLSDAKIRKGVAKLRRAQASNNLPRSNAA